MENGVYLNITGSLKKIAIVSSELSLETLNIYKTIELILWLDFNFSKFIFFSKTTILLKIYFNKKNLNNQSHHIGLFMIFFSLDLIYIEMIFGLFFFQFTILKGYFLTM